GESEWRAGEDPFPMLVFLRGDVPPEQRDNLSPTMHGSGDELFPGQGERMSANQCRQYILKTASRLRQFDLDDSSRNALDVYESYAKGRASFEDFYQACNSTYESLLSG